MMKERITRNPVSTLAAVARGVALALSAPFILGFLWFFGSFNGMWLAYWFTSVPCMVIVPILPRRFLYRFLLVRAVVVLACGASILLTLPIMHFDLTLVNGADYPAFVLRCIQAAALAVLLVEAIVNPKTKTQNQASHPIAGKSGPG